MTLIELLVAMSLALVVGGAAMGFLIVTLNQQNNVSSRAVTTRTGQTQLATLTRDLHNAMSQDGSGNTKTFTMSMPTASTTQLVFSVPSGTGSTADQTAATVTWLCTNAATTPGTCTRTVGSTTQTVITGLSSVTFTAQSSTGANLPLSTAQAVSSPAFIGVTLNLDVISQSDSSQSHVLHGTVNTVALQAGIDLRNFA
jgi:type II secretory pathway pseudopilin PulG